MNRAISTWAEAGRGLLRRYRDRLPLYVLVAAALAVLALLLPSQLMSWERWVLLVSCAGIVVVGVDFNLMLWRIYRRRNDLATVRLSLALIGGFVGLVALGRVVGFASLFFQEILWVVSLINLLSAGVATVLVVRSREVEAYANTMPELADLQAANQELQEARRQLQLREDMALEGMLMVADDCVMKANSEAYRILGYDEASHELIGLRVHQFVHEDYSQQAYTNLRQEHTPPYLIKLLRKNGSVVQVEATGIMVRQLGNNVRLAFFRDVSIQVHCLEVLGGQVKADDRNELLIRTADELRRYFHDKYPIPANGNAA